jgi:hypothetical protein
VQQTFYLKDTCQYLKQHWSQLNSRFGGVNGEALRVFFKRGHTDYSNMRRTLSVGSLKSKVLCCRENPFPSIIFLYFIPVRQCLLIHASSMIVSYVHHKTGSPYGGFCMTVGSHREEPVSNWVLRKPVSIIWKRCYKEHSSSRIISHSLIFFFGYILF